LKRVSTCELNEIHTQPLILNPLTQR
jgi:hypothetical protein